MSDVDMMARAELLSLRDYVGRILMANGPVFDPGAGLTLFGCYGLSHVLASRNGGGGAARLNGEVLIWLAEACRTELARVEKAIEEAGTVGQLRLVPTEFSEDEVTLRALHENIDRYFDGLEPEYSHLPAHILGRVLAQLQLLKVWDIPDRDYPRGLQAGIRGLERAVLAAMSAPRN